MKAQLVNFMGMLYSMSPDEYRRFLIDVAEGNLNEGEALLLHGNYVGCITQNATNWTNVTNVTNWTRDDYILALEQL